MGPFGHDSRPTTGTEDAGAAAEFALATEPWARADPASWRLRAERRFGPACGPVNRLVERLRAETGEHIPWVDPFCGGADAPVRLVALRPGPLGAAASDFLSLANADQTARNAATAMRQAGLACGDLAFWNAIPWPGPREERITGPMRQRGEEMLGRLLPLLPRLRAVLLLGGEAHRLRPAVRRWRPGVRVVESPHTSPLAWNRTRHREATIAAFREAADAKSGP